MAARRASAVVAVVVLAGCTHSEPAAERESKPVARSGELIVDAGETPIGAPHVVGNRIYGVAEGGEPIAARPMLAGPLVGTLAPVAVPGNGVIAYNAWERGRPLVRLYDIERRRHRVVAARAYAVAVRHDGALAYFTPQGAIAHARASNRGHVLVRRTPSARPRRWSSAPGRYVPAAWAGRRLVVYRLTRRWPDVIVFEGPRRPRLLVHGSALVALSPDGARALITPLGASPPAVRVVEVDGGDEVASLRLSRGVRWIADSGSWAGDLAVAAVDRGLVVLRVRSQSLAVEQLLHLDAEEFPLSASEPRLEDGGRRIVAWAERAQQVREAVPKAVLLDCDRFSLRCARGPTTASLEPPRPVYNPSRP